ncbi:MAG: Crp/Fnr family transcriptional regulator [Marinobacter sp.]|nr:Crp/Fnr family transcriptional regulator [Marinobacter sp.]
MASFHALSCISDNPVLLEAVAASEADEALDALRQHPLFNKLQNEDFEYIVGHLRRIKLGHHQLLYRQDTVAQNFFFVVSGRVRLFRLDYTGVERTLDSLGPGDCFAEVMIYADPAQYACYAEALKQTEVLMIPIRAFRALIARQPAYADLVMRHYAMRAVERFHDLEIMTVQNARDRLIRYLLDLVPAHRLKDVEVELPLPKCLVASRLAMQPETFSRILGELKSNGLVRVNRSRVIIQDPGRLAQLTM